MQKNTRNWLGISYFSGFLEISFGNFDRRYTLILSVSCRFIYSAVWRQKKGERREIEIENEKSVSKEKKRRRRRKKKKRERAASDRKGVRRAPRHTIADERVRDWAATIKGTTREKRQTDGRCVWFAGQARRKVSRCALLCCRHLVLNQWMYQ